MGTPQQFSLKWNNYSQSVITAFEDLRGEDDLTDVTLSCEGKKIKAHRVLLSACSVYFKETFRENPCQHPVIVFNGISYLDLQAVVTFVYNGQVSVSQERLSTFLQAAELLQVKGLTDIHDQEDSFAKKSSLPTTISSPESGVSNVGGQPSGSEIGSFSPEVLTVHPPARPVTPGIKRRRIGPACFMNTQSQKQDDPPMSVNNQATLTTKFPSSSVGLGSTVGNGRSSNVISPPLAGPSGVSSSTGGLLKPETVMIHSEGNITPANDLESTETFPPGIMKFEEQQFINEGDDYEKEDLIQHDSSHMQEMLSNVEQDSNSIVGFLVGDDDQPPGQNVSVSQSQEPAAFVAERVGGQVPTNDVSVDVDKPMREPSPKSDPAALSCKTEEDDDCVVIGSTQIKKLSPAEKNGSTLSSGIAKTERYLAPRISILPLSALEEPQVVQIPKPRKSTFATVPQVQFEYVSCPVCNANIPKYAIRDHMLNAHSTTEQDSENRELCSHCGKYFKNKNSLKVHRSIYHRNQSLPSSNKPAGSASFVPTNIYGEPSTSQYFGDYSSREHPHSIFDD